jgi:transposase-like protein DUF772
MAMGKRKRQRQQALWVEAQRLAKGPSHPFYSRLNEILVQEGFDGFVEAACRRFYSERIGRPSLPPAVYFRLLLIGYFEGIDSERGIAWRVADSIALREFLGYALTEPTPDHSTISRNRRLIDVRRICAEGALLEVVIGLDPERDRGEIERLGLEPLSLAYVDAALVPRYRDAGFEVLERGLLAAPDWSQLRTSWAKRLRGGGSRTVLYLIAREIPIP